ncbi:hypothetical protein ACVWWO_002869 [Bradyrhizobium sp. F1.13.1]
MRRARRQAERDLFLAKRGHDLPAVAMRRVRDLVHLGFVAEAYDLAPPVRRLDPGGQHQHAFRRQTEGNRHLLAADGFERAELLQMHRLDVDDERDCRPRQFAEPRDFAGLVHAHLDDPETGIGAAHYIASTARPRNC